MRQSIDQVKIERAKAFLAQIQRELEGNERLRRMFPDVLYDDPQNEAPSWSLDAGLIVRRRSNPPVATVEAHGLVDGQPTVLTGTDRTFESPRVEGGKEIRYELTARWVERGATFERKKVVTGKPGEVVRVDFNLPDGVVGR